MEALASILIGIVVVIVLLGGQKALAWSRRRAFSRGGDVSFRVRLAGSAPLYPTTPRRGRFALGPSGIVFTPSGGGPVLDLTLTGVRPVNVRSPRKGESRGNEGLLVLTAADGMGTALRLVGSVESVRQLENLLSVRGVPPAPTPPVTYPGGRRRRGRLVLVPAVLLVLVAAFGVGMASWVGFSGVHVMATVLTEEDDDGYCDVQWVDPRDGTTHINGADCYWDVGDEVDFIALAEPWRGEVVEAEDIWWWTGASAAAALGGGAILVSRARRRRRDAKPVVLVPRGTAAPPTPTVLTENQLSYDEVVAAMRVRAGAEAWSFDVQRSPGGATPRLSTRRSLLGYGLLRVLVPLVIGGIAAMLVGWTSFAGLWASSGPTATVVASIDEDPVDTVPFAPADLEVTFPLRDGGMSTTLVAVVGLPEPRPETIRVQYDLDDPDRARALEHDGVPRGAGMGGIAILIGLGMSLWRGWGMQSTWRDDARARRSGPGRRVQYVLVPGFDEDTVLLLYSDGPQAPPPHVLELIDDVQGIVPGTGTAEVRGTYAAGEVVVPYLEGRELFTGSRLLELDPQDVVDLVNSVGSLDEDDV